MRTTADGAVRLRLSHEIAEIGFAAGIISQGKYDHCLFSQSGRKGVPSPLPDNLRGRVVGIPGTNDERPLKESENAGTHSAGAAFIPVYALKWLGESTVPRSPLTHHQTPRTTRTRPPPHATTATG